MSIFASINLAKQLQKHKWIFIEYFKTTSWRFMKHGDRRSAVTNNKTALDGLWEPLAVCGEISRDETQLAMLRGKGRP